MAIQYRSGGVTVSIGKFQQVAIPPRVFRGRASCMHFDTDKAFLLPPSVPGVRNIARFFAEHPGMTMLVNGHTDLVGDAQYNLSLSVERANAVTAYLQDRPDDWMPWYQSGVAAKRWSYREDQHMLGAVTDAAGAPYYAGAPTGADDAGTRAAATRFQTDQGLTPDGLLGPITRRALVAAYMALEGTSVPAAAAVMVHGCGKFHPLDATAAADEGNRRVEIFLFDGPVEPAAQTPCPSPGCAAYAVWVGKALQDVNLCDEQPPQLLDLMWVSARYEGAGISLEQVLHAGDAELKRVAQPSADGTDPGADSRFAVDLRDLTDAADHSTHVTAEAGLVSTRVVFSPARLKAALAANDPAAISAAIQLRGWS